MTAHLFLPGTKNRRRAKRRGLPLEPGCQRLEPRFLLSLAPNSIAGDVGTIFATSGLAGAQPPAAVRFSFAASGNGQTSLNLISGKTGTGSFNYTVTGPNTANVTNLQDSATVKLTFTGAGTGTYTEDVVVAGNSEQAQAGLFVLQTPPFVTDAPAALTGSSLALNIGGGNAGGPFQTSGTSNLVLNSASTFTDTGSSTTNGTYSYTQTVGATPGVAEVVLNDSSDPTSFLYLAYAASTSGTFYRTDATLPGGQSAHNDFQFGTFSGQIALPSQLAFGPQATSVVSVNATIAPAVTVDVRDAGGHIVTSNGSTVSLAISNGPAGGVLGGTSAVAAQGGIATFSDLTLSQPGTYTLTATDGSLSSAVSTFTVAVPRKTGLLDPTFGTGGVASHNVGFTATSGLAIQPDGKSVIAGVIGSPGSQEFGLTRYNADGSLDTTFGTNGVASVSLQGTDDQPSSVTVLPNGEILEAGTSAVENAGAVVGSDFAVALFNASGLLDTSFGGGTGKVLTNFSSTSTPSTDIANALVLGNGGEFFVVGSSTANGSGKDLAIAAFNADGSPATGFNGTGRELLDFAGGDDSANAAVVQSNGELVVAGSTENPSSAVTSVAVVRLLANGALDTHFGTKGKVVTNLRGVDDAATSVAIGAKGAIVVGGLSCTGSFSAGTIASDFAVLRYTSTGKADHTFGGKGFVITSFGEDAAITSVLVQSDGGIVASGKTAASFSSAAAGQLGIAVARYNSNGSLDTSFNGSGKTLVTLTGQSATSNLLHPSNVTRDITPDITAVAADDQLQQDFNAFVSSAQGIVATTPGGNLAVAGNSGGFTEEGQLVATGIDLAASLLASLPASEKPGAFATVGINITDNSSAAASGTVTVQIFVSGASTNDTGDTSLFSHPEAIKLKASKAKSFKLKVKLPPSLAAGQYFLVASVTTGAIQDLNPVNNIAFKGPFAVT
jgi:uncharacterized delta-60 repeat protein